MKIVEKEMWGSIGIGGLVMAGIETPVWRIATRVLRALYYLDSGDVIVPVCKDKGEDKDTILKRIQSLQVGGRAIEVMFCPSKRKKDMKRARDRRWRESNRAKKVPADEELYLEYDDKYLDIASIQL